MLTFLKKYLLIPLIFLVSELSFNLFSEHIMKSNSYMVTKEYVSNFFIKDKKTIEKFTATKNSYTLPENVIFKVKINKPSFLYLLILRENEGYLKEISLEEKNKEINTTIDRKGFYQFYLLNTKNKLDYRNTSSSFLRNDAIKIMERVVQKDGEKSQRVELTIN